MYDKVLQGMSKCCGSPFTAFGPAVSSGSARGAPAGESYPGSDAGMSMASMIMWQTDLHHAWATNNVS